MVSAGGREFQCSIGYGSLTSNVWLAVAALFRPQARNMRTTFFNDLPTCCYCCCFKSMCCFKLGGLFTYPVVGVHDDVHLEHLSAREGIEGIPVDVRGAVHVAAFIGPLRIREKIRCHRPEADAGEEECNVRHMFASVEFSGASRRNNSRNVTTCLLRSSSLPF